MSTPACIDTLPVIQLYKDFLGSSWKAAADTSTLLNFSYLQLRQREPLLSLQLPLNTFIYMSKLCYVTDT